VDRLLPQCNPYPLPNSVIIMDNASSHCDPIIAEAVHAKGCLIRYLPPYSPDFSPIELSFSVLKAWVRRRFQELWIRGEGSFGDFLLIAIRQSRCDRFTENHFRHSGNGGYIFEGDMEAFDRELRDFARGRGNDELDL
jgi:transposase